VRSFGDGEDVFLLFLRFQNAVKNAEYLAQRGNAERGAACLPRRGFEYSAVDVVGDSGARFLRVD
jgi:hypothetical protein